MVIKPSNRRAEPVDWKIAEHTRETVKNFAEYAEYPEEEIVERCLQLLLDDEGFQDWVVSRRYTTRLLARLYPGTLRDKIASKLEDAEKGV